MENDIMTLDEILQDPYYMEQFNQKIQATTAITGHPQGTKGTNMADETTNVQETTTETTETAKTFTQDDLNRVGTKEKKQGEMAILKELGLTSKDELATVKEILTVHNSEKASKLTAADIQKTFDEFKAASEADKAAIIAEREQARQEAWCAKNNIPEDKADFYLFKIGKLMAAEELDFSAAAAQYLKDNPVSTKDNKPPMWGGAGTKALNSITPDDFKKMKFSDMMKLKAENPTLYEQLKG